MGEKCHDLASPQLGYYDVNHILKQSVSFPESTHGAFALDNDAPTIRKLNAQTLRVPKGTRVAYPLGCTLDDYCQWKQDSQMRAPAGYITGGLRP
jgi:hypothetical protein